MAQLLETDSRGRRALTWRRAKELAGIGAAGSWYIAPLAMHWTIGLISVYDHDRYHVLDDSGEPLRFQYEWDAWEYLRRELKVPSWQLPPPPQKPVSYPTPFPALGRVLPGMRSNSRR
jgi:hypothetical protein